jgi:hypothetical protein
MKKTVLTTVLLMPVCLSMLVLAAHFLRAIQPIPTAIYVFLMFFLFMFKPINARLVQLALLMGTIEWISTAIALSAQRAAMGAPATRMLIILGSVAAVTFLSIFLFYTPTLKARFGLAAEKEGTNPEAPEPENE